MGIDEGWDRLSLRQVFILMKRRALIEKVWDGRFCALLANSYGYLSQKPDERMKLDQIFPSVFESPAEPEKRQSPRIRDNVAATKAMFGLSPFTQ